MNRLATETDLPVPGCPQAANAAAWAVGELDPDAQRAYRKQTVSQLRDVRLPEVEPSSGLTDRIMAALPPDAFRVTRFARVLSFARRHRYQVAAAAAVVMAVGSLGVLHFSLRTSVDAGLAAHAGCAWIARQQDADGSWDPVQGGGSALYRPALTALASLALLRETDRYSKEVTAACAALRRFQEPDGAFGADSSGRMYNHALATWALLAAYDKGSHPELKDALDKAVAFIRSRQQATGGWGYSASADVPANTAVTAWQVQVLARAQQAGWDDAGGHLRKGLNWLRQRAGNSGQFGYTAARGDASATPTLNAMGAYTLLTCGSARPELVQVATAVLAHLRTDPQAGKAKDADFYRAFFTVAAWEAAGDSRRADRMRAVVCDRRETHGADQGSWAPTDDWSKVGGRLYATSLAVLTLQSRKGG